jgi:hypothetical protein
LLLQQDGDAKRTDPARRQPAGRRRDRPDSAARTPAANPRGKEAIPLLEKSIKKTRKTSACA